MKLIQFKYKGYIAIGELAYNGEEVLYIGEVANSGRAVLIFHGNSLAQFENNFHNTIDEYLEYCKTCGVEPEMSVIPDHGHRIE